MGWLSLSPVVASGQASAGHATAPDRAGYVGDASCQKCHADLSGQFEHTPHHLTSQLPTSRSVHGSFQAGANTLTIVDPKQSAKPALQFHM